MAMASEHKNIGKRRAPLADCTNTPPLSRPRRACGAYASPAIDAQFIRKRPADPENQSNDAESTTTPACHLRKNSNSNQNFSTPQTVLPAVDVSPLPKENEGECFTDFRVYSKRRRSKGRALETLSSSCPPLRRPSSDSPAVERRHRYRSQSTEVRKRRPIDDSTDLPEAGRLKKV